MPLLQSLPILHAWHVTVMTKKDHVSFWDCLPLLEKEEKGEIPS